MLGCSGAFNAAIKTDYELAGGYFYIRKNDDRHWHDIK